MTRFTAMPRTLFRRAALFTLAALALPLTTQAQEWKPAPAPLMTRWAKDVSPTKVRPEYPRPQFVRKEWKSLNGLWQFAFDDKNAFTVENADMIKSAVQKILVPFTFESALSGIGKGKEIHEHVLYRRMFDVPKNWNSKHTILNFGAVDWDTTVYVNGQNVGQHRGGYTPFSCDITEALKPEGQQEVIVAVYDPADTKGEGWQPKGKQLGSESIWYTRTTGIWQTVWLEPVPELHINAAQIWTLDNTRQLMVMPSTTAQFGQDATLTVTLSHNGLSAGEVTNQLGTTRGIVVDVKNPDYWTPEHPALYDVTLTLKQGNKVLDEVKSYTALRTIGIENGRLTLNGKPYFYRGVLDQGFWPDGIYTPPTDAAIRSDVEMTKKTGFNMARKHVKVDDPRWYYWCDKLGLAVWQDMPSSHNLSSKAAQENFTHEWYEVINTVRSYPCVVHYIPFNENWGNPQEFQDSIVKLTRSIDSTRPVTDASGWTQREMTQVIDAHDYGNNLLRQGVANPVKPKVVGEYGGIALPVPGHTWSQGWGYQNARDANGLLKRVRNQTSQLFEAQNLSGFVYTQLTDVEQELNGLLTYDRLPKAPVQGIADVFTGKSRSAQTDTALHDWLVLGPVPAGSSLTTGEDTAENQAALKTILAGAFVPHEADLQPMEGSSEASGANALKWQKAHTDGDALDFNKIFGSQTDNAVVYAVAYINSPKEVKEATLLFGSDDGAVVWLNGEKIHTTAKVRGVSAGEDVISRLTLKAGRNVLVVKVAQGVGGWGISAAFELPEEKSVKTN